MNESVLTIPRRLVQQVFHHAQVAPGGVTSGLIGEAAGTLRSYPAVGGDLRAQHDALRARGERLFAVYHVHPQGPHTPAAGEQDPDHFVFIISLDTRGVLQLHAWRGDEELPAKIIED